MQLSWCEFSVLRRSASQGAGFRSRTTTHRVPLPVITVLVQPFWGYFFRFLCKILHEKFKSCAVNPEVRRMRREFNAGAKGANEILCCDSCAARKDRNDTSPSCLRLLPDLDNSGT